VILEEVSMQEPAQRALKVCFLVVFFLVCVHGCPAFANVPLGVLNKEQCI
jgi:hypothetical protein